MQPEDCSSKLKTDESLGLTAENLLGSVNDTSKTVAGLHLAFIAFYAYVAVIIWSTTHEDLLRVKPVSLPILQTQLSLIGFYQVVPWLLVLIHLNLLMQLYLLSRKLWKLRGMLERDAGIAPLADKLSSFPFTQLVAVLQQRQFVRGLLTLLVSVSVILVPVALLVYAQLKFLPFHDEFVTWMQRAAVLADIGILGLLWPRLASPTGRWGDWWRAFGRIKERLSWNKKDFEKRHGPIGAMTLIVAALAGMLLSIVALVPAGAMRPPQDPGGPGPRAGPRTRALRFSMSACAP